MQDETKIYEIEDTMDTVDRKLTECAKMLRTCLRELDLLDQADPKVKQYTKECLTALRKIDDVFMA